MHKVFELMGAKKINNSNCLWELTLKRNGKVYSLTSEFTPNYIDNCVMDHKIDFKDDYWLDEHLKEID